MLIILDTAAVEPSVITPSVPATANFDNDPDYLYDLADDDNGVDDGVDVHDVNDNAAADDDGVNDDVNDDDRASGK